MVTTASHAVPASTNALLVLSLKAKSTLSTLTFVLIAALALMFAPLALSLRANNSSCNTRQLNSLKSCMSCFSRQQLFFVPKLRTLGALEDWLKRATLRANNEQRGVVRPGFDTFYPLAELPAKGFTSCQVNKLVCHTLLIMLMFEW